MTWTATTIDFYELLSVPPRADRQAIHEAYVRQLKHWHPDKNRQTEEAIAAAEEMTKALNEAYFILSDPKRRRDYDRMRRFTRNKSFDECLDEKVFREKMDQAGPIFKNIMANLRDLYRLFHDAVNKEYPLTPARLGIIAGALLYFIIPTDFIPDFLPLGGYLDDLSILTMAINALQNELANWRQQKSNRN